MIKVNVVCVGKVKEKYFSEGIAEYSKRLARFCDFNIIELQEENFNKVDDGKIKQILEREAERILPNLSGEIYCLAIEGKEFSSVELAKELQKNIDKGASSITFVIGGSYGLDEKIKKRAKTLLSFSKMTFPHTLFRLMLTEQLYRAFSINAGSNYHK